MKKEKDDIPSKIEVEKGKPRMSRRLFVFGEKETQMKRGDTMSD